METLPEVLKRIVAEYLERKERERGADQQTSQSANPIKPAP